MDANTGLWAGFWDCLKVLGSAISNWASFDILFVLEELSFESSALLGDMEPSSDRGGVGGHTRRWTP